MTCLVMLVPARTEALVAFTLTEDGSGLVSESAEVTLMRHQEQSFFTFRQHYRGKPRPIALLIPVPAKTKKMTFKVIKSSYFDELQARTAPHLAVYEEHAPCDEAMRQVLLERTMTSSNVRREHNEAVPSVDSARPYTVELLEVSDVEEIEAWAKTKGFRLSNKRAALLAPHVTSKTRLIAATLPLEALEPSKRGGFTFSPLRLSYESDSPEVPLTLGSLGASAPQELLVHTFSSRDVLFPSNYTAALIPTNLVLTRLLRSAFPAFYRGLFLETLDAQHTSLIVEYGGEQGSRNTPCEGCEQPVLSSAALHALGGELLVQRDEKLVYRPESLSMRGNMPLALKLSQTLMQNHSRGTIPRCYTERNMLETQQRPDTIRASYRFTVSEREEPPSVTIEAREGVHDAAFEACLIAQLTDELRMTRERMKGATTQLELAFDMSLEEERKPLNPATIHFMLMRYHGLFSPDTPREPLRFHTTPQRLTGGIGTPRGESGQFEVQHTLLSYDNIAHHFEARYVRLKPSGRAPRCEAPRRWVWDPVKGDALVVPFPLEMDEKSFSDKMLDDQIQRGSRDATALTVTHGGE